MDCVGGADHGLRGDGLWSNTMEYCVFPDRPHGVVRCGRDLERPRDHVDPRGCPGCDDGWNGLELVGVGGLAV